MAIAQHKDGRWYEVGRKGFWPDEPDRTREYFGRGPAAEQAARARNYELIGDKTILNDDSGPTFSELAGEYSKYRGLPTISQNNLDIKLNKIILPKIGRKLVSRLSDSDLDQYVAIRRSHITRKKTAVKNNTIRRELTYIKAILNWSTKRKPPLLRFNPVADYRLPDSDDEVIMPPTVEEVEAIYETAADHLKRAIMLSWYLGLRPGSVELLSLTWSNVSLEVGIIRIMSAHKGGPRMRDVPINRALRIQLEEWKKRDGGRGHLIRYHGKPLSKIHGAWKNALERAGIKRRLRPYDLRHHFATRALESGAIISM